MFSSNKNISTDAILDSISDGVFTIDKHWRITSFNRAAEEITGICCSEAVGQLCSEVFKSNLCESKCPLRQTLKDGKALINRPAYIVNIKGQPIPISISTAVLRDNKGEIIGGAETFRDLSEIEGLRKELKGQYQVGDMISHSSAMKNIIDLVPAVSSSLSNILIQGNTGTGKEILAKTIHKMSSRAKQPFIAINCAALPDQLLESELFGYKKGAFTGATKDKAGRFELAQNGTIFLDEIGEVSPAFQVKLLRVLQEHTYEPLGAIKTLRTNARVIAATNKNLIDMVNKGTFRQDLFYRLNVILMELPDLNHRKEDLPLLVTRFIQRFNKLQNKSISGITPNAYSVLMAHNWPGNIRELENIIERAFVLCTNQQIDTTHLPPELLNPAHPKPKQTANISSIIQTTERQSIVSSLIRNNYNRTKTAKELGIHKATLYRKMKKLQIPLPNANGRCGG